MGRNELNDDEAMRALLAAYEEPVVVPPPSQLSRRVIAALPKASPATLRAERRRRALGGRLAIATPLTLVLLLNMIGLWGLLGDSTGPARLFASLNTSFGEAIFVLTLAAKPILNLLTVPGPATLLVALTLLAAGAWGWWQLVRVELLHARAEVGGCGISARSFLSLFSPYCLRQAPYRPRSRTCSSPSVRHIRAIWRAWAALLLCSAVSRAMSPIGAARSRSRARGAAM
ncbi:hypothetical protein HC891_08870 [Candidatus Gracilibacteria bacterium]|nr:hypothetical protein [Candidatus Gracilibacteria bacterium]